MSAWPATQAQQQAGQYQQDDTLQLARSHVKNLLTRSKAFNSLPPARRTALAHDMVKVARYMADAGGETRNSNLAAIITPGSDSGTEALARPFAEGDRPATAGGDFQAQGGAVAAQTGGEALTDIISTADFPGFVGGLVEGVFSAVVQASIDQMEAYATLLQNVAKTADDYMRDNITEDQARDSLVERYPDHLEADFSGGQPRVRPRQDADESSMPDFMKDLGLPFPIDALDDDVVEEQLVPAQRQKMAIDRQQLLLSLVVMGINRIVVTDGKINASVVFTLDTRDAVQRHMERNRTFESQSEYSRSRSGWFRPTTNYNRKTKLNVQTASTDDSEAEVNLKTTMKGSVDLRFRSETFPLDRISDIIGVDRERVNARPPTVGQSTA